MKKLIVLAFLLIGFSGFSQRYELETVGNFIRIYDTTYNGVEISRPKEAVYHDIIGDVVKFYLKYDGTFIGKLKGYSISEIENKSSGIIFTPESLDLFLVSKIGSSNSGTSGSQSITDTTAPVISLNGDSTINLEEGNTYTELGAATDDGSTVVINSSSVDTGTIGTYTVTYNATDAAGNAATQITRTVVVAAQSQKTVVVLGASIVEGAFGRNLSTPNTEMTSSLTALGVDNITAYGYGIGGALLADGPNMIDTALAAHPDAYFVIHLGGGDIGQTRAYADRSTAVATQFTTELQAIRDKFIGSEDKLILIPPTFRNYSNTSAYDGDIRGSYPFIVNEYLSLIPTDQQNDDGFHIIDWYNSTRNNHRTWYDWSPTDSYDVTHPNDFGDGELLQLTVERFNYTINKAGAKPSAITPTVFAPLSSGTPSFDAIVAFGDFAGTTTMRSASLEAGTPVNILDFSGVDTGAVITSTGTDSIPALNEQGGDFGAATYDNTLENNEIYNSTLFHSSANSFTHAITNLEPNGLYTLSFCGSRIGTAEARTTRFTVGSDFVEISTSIDPPNAPVSLDVVADANGDIDILQTCVLGGFGYIGGLRIQNR